MQFNANRVGRIFTITFAITILLMSVQVAAAPSEPTEQHTTVSGYVMRCYDGRGFADIPSGSSTLETTFNAISLISESRDTWSHKLWSNVEHIVERYASMQSLYRGGFIADGETEPDFRTTALILETLKIIDRLDSVDISMVKRYLWSSFRESLSVDLWISEGDFETKYWALRAAYAIDYVDGLGLHEISLDNIIAPNANRADFPEAESYLVWNTHHFEDTQFGGFGTQSEDRKSEIIHSFSMMMNDLYAPTIMPLMVDTDTLVESILSKVNPKTGMAMDESGRISHSLSLQLYTTLDRIGRLDALYNDEWGAYRAVASRNTITQTTETWTAMTSNDSAHVSDIYNQIQLDQMISKAINGDVVRFRPTFTDSVRSTTLASTESNDSEINSWDAYHETIVWVPNDLLDQSVSAQNNPSITPLLLIVAMLIAIFVSGGKYSNNPYHYYQMPGVILARNRV